MTQQIKILAGRAKGTTLKTLEGLHTRPTTGRICENLFNLLSHHRFSETAFLWHNQTVLDLCAGSGRLGLEALSRGAKSAVFIENNPDAVMLIKQNVHKIHMLPQAEILMQNIEKPLLYKGQFLPASLVFCDAPYQSSIFTNAMTHLLTSHYLVSGAIIVHEDHHETTPFIHEKLALVLEKKYGITILRFYIFIAH